MFKFIRHVRAQPVAYRRKVAFLGAAGITGLIVVLWIIALVVQLDRAVSSEPAVAARSSTSSGPWETLKSSFEEGFSVFNETVQEE